MVERQIKFILPFPEKLAREYWYASGRSQRRIDDMAHDSMGASLEEQAESLVFDSQGR